MFSEKMWQQAQVMMEDELANILIRHGEFNSTHEGWAVLKEEIEELIDCINIIKHDFESTWSMVKDDDYEGLSINTVCIRNNAKAAICGAVQVGAVAKKIMMYMDYITKE